MQNQIFRAIWPFLVKTVVPAALGSLGTMAAVVWSDGFRAFCGVS